ncbi:MAG: hypothetical protein HYV07_06990 [Deltaproteobacteria bacterium]|nr:hypothetical protein [Deltaproteobacteria bacterium]
MSFTKEPIRPDRVRAIGPDGFAFLPNRFFREGFFAALEPNELRLYVFLVLAANRTGLSFYHYDRICSTLEMPLDDYIAARNRLIDRDLIAFDGSRFQVLELPTRSRETTETTSRARLTTPAADPESSPNDSAARLRAIIESIRR